MSLSSSNQDNRRFSQRKDELPPRILTTTLQVGGLSGVSGLFVGAIAGTLRSANPILFSFASGIQCFILGSSITAFRELIIYSWKSDKVSPSDKLLISSIAGALGGGVSGAILRGRKNIIPGSVMFALFATTGQIILNNLEQRKIRHRFQDSRTMNSWMSSKWLPIRAMPDKEYEKILKNQLTAIKAEIALIDKKIEELRKN
ncbi:hypothetical protein OnM2_064006 [Erysiphe neolycopersici]|uniref:Uncharacterized protein n=1 Tax=Erysiphe neolycopersici TaxID=212602 RepID=A0A420HN71_9PEZI|nr:hypothetical protein OnM2_064006 [Erysiphe neolycopersici]